MSEALGEYMHASLWPRALGDHRKTHIWQITDRHGGVLGHVKWHGAWRQYTFWPEPMCVFNRGCLEEMTKFLAQAMADRQTATVVEPIAIPAPLSNGTVRLRRGIIR